MLAARLSTDNPAPIKVSVSKFIINYYFSKLVKYLNLDKNIKITINKISYILFQTHPYN